MPLIKCPTCLTSVSDAAVSCPKCGHPLQTPSASPAGFQFAGNPAQVQMMVFSRGWEYKSKISIAGIPLIHVASGFNPQTGAKRVAKGIIAIGDIAIGLFALGGLSIGGIAIGGAAFGICALGGLAVAAFLAVGGGAIGYIALGGGALGYYAFGGGAFGAHTVSALSQDPEAVEFLKRTFGINFTSPFSSFSSIPWDQLKNMPKPPGR